MDQQQFEKFLEDNRRSTADAIEKTVNGKIRAIHNLLEDQNRESKDFRDKMEKHVKTVEPYIVGVESTKLVASWTGKALMWIGGFVLTVGGAYFFIKAKLSQ